MPKVIGKSLPLVALLLVAWFLIFVLTYTWHEDRVRRAAQDLKLGMRKAEVLTVLKEHGLSLSRGPWTFDGDPRDRTRPCGLLTGFSYCSSGVFFFDESGALEGVSLESWKWDHDMPVEFLLPKD
jgi:hypothetical protein